MISTDTNQTLVTIDFVTNQTSVSIIASALFGTTVLDEVISRSTSTADGFRNGIGDSTTSGNMTTNDSGVDTTLLVGGQSISFLTLFTSVSRIVFETVFD